MKNEEIENSSSKNEREILMELISNDIATYLNRFDDMNCGIKKLALNLTGKVEKKSIMLVKRWINKDCLVSRGYLVKLYSLIKNCRTTHELKSSVDPIIFKAITNNFTDHDIKQHIIIPDQDFNKDAFLSLFNESKQHADIFSMALISKGIKGYDLTMKYGSFGVEVAEKYVSYGALVRQKDQSYTLSEQFQSSDQFNIDITKYLKESFNIEDIASEYKTYVGSGITSVSVYGFELLMKLFQKCIEDAQVIAEVHEADDIIVGYSSIMIDLFDKREELVKKSIKGKIIQ